MTNNKATSTFFGLIAISMFALPILVSNCTVFATDDSITITIDKSTVEMNVAPKNTSGTFAKSNNSTVSVTTTNSTGYTLGIMASSSTNAGKLVNEDDNTKALSSIATATTEEQFKALAGTAYNGMWGYLPSKLNSTANTSFLPAPTVAGDVWDETSVANPTTANTYTLAVGARVDISQKLGNYNNTYVIYANANPIPYSITYDDNVVSNMPSDVNSGQAAGGSVTFANNVPTRSGYKFLGWCTVATADPASSASDCTATGGTFYAAGATTTIGTATDFHLYAMWAQPCAGYTTMQGLTSSTIATLLPNTGNTATVCDIRDEEKYLIGKLADNKYWMLDNLRLGSNSTIALTPSDTNIASNFTLPASINSGFNSYTEAQINADYKNDTTTSYGSGSGKVGVYYNYCAASAGTICTEENYDDASYDICPAGWRMPTGSSSGEYQSLYTAYSSNATNFRNALSTPLSGEFYDNLQSGLGRYGSFWSSTVVEDGENAMYYLGVDSSYVTPTLSYDRDRGYSIRCLAK